MRGKGVEEIGFPELVKGVDLSVVKVWLALLLYEFELRQEGEFYEQRGISVKLYSNLPVCFDLVTC